MLDQDRATTAKTLTNTLATVGETIGASGRLGNASALFIAIVDEGDLLPVFVTSDTHLDETIEAREDFLQFLPSSQHSTTQLNMRGKVADIRQILILTTCGSSAEGPPCGTGPLLTGLWPWPRSPVDPR